MENDSLAIVSARCFACSIRNKQGITKPRVEMASDGLN